MKACGKVVGGRVWVWVQVLFWARLPGSGRPAPHRQATVQHHLVAVAQRCPELIEGGHGSGGGGALLDPLSHLERVMARVRARWRGCMSE